MLHKVAFALVGSALFCFPAQAYTITTGGSSVLNNGQFSTVASAVTIDFTSNAPTTGIAQYNSATANVVTGNSSGYASPPNDTTKYFSIGPSTVSTATITFTSSINYFGFFAGSLDSFNSIQFFRGNSTIGYTSILTLDGTQIASQGGFAAIGDQTQGLYINIFASNSSEIFTRIVFSSVSNAFETDNHAYRVGSTPNVPVPEPNPMLSALLTFGLGVLSVKTYKSPIAVENHLSTH
jgi:hypothetical protein